MEKTFTHEFMLANKGCYGADDLNACSFMKLEIITSNSILHSEIPLKDKFWFFCKKVFTKEQNQQIAIECAELVLPIYEKRYPNDVRPREAIEAAKQFIAGHISLETLLEKRRAADAAADAADAAAVAAAYPAAYAAYAADAAAREQLFSILTKYLHGKDTF